MQIPKFILGTLLAMAMLSAQAAPETEDYETSPGATVKVILGEEELNLLAYGVYITFTYNSTYLHLAEVIAGGIWPADTVMSLFPEAPEEPTTAIFSSVPIEITNGTGSLLELSFQVKAAPFGTNMDIFPPVDTFVTFDCPKEESRCEEYVFTKPATSTIRIDRSTQIPLPGTLPLIALGMATLVWARRRMK